MELGFIPEELMKAFADGMEASIELVKKDRARETAVSPSEQIIRQQVAEKMADLKRNELLHVYIVALLMVIEANNKRIAQQLQPYLKSRSGKQPK